MFHQESFNIEENERNISRIIKINEKSKENVKVNKKQKKKQKIN